MSGWDVSIALSDPLGDRREQTLADDALIDAIARLRERGIRAGLSVSGAGQDVAIRGRLEVRRDGQRVFDSVQATWNLLERGAESALEDAHAAGMKVVVKESLANGRLTHGNRNDDEMFYPLVAEIRAVAENRGTSMEKLAIAAALARPWANVVLTGAATVEQVRSNVSALEFASMLGWMSSFVRCPSPPRNTGALAAPSNGTDYRGRMPPRDRATASSES